MMIWLKRKSDTRVPCGQNVPKVCDDAYHRMSYYRCGNNIEKNRNTLYWLFPVETNLNLYVFISRSHVPNRDKICSENGKFFSAESSHRILRAKQFFVFKACNCKNIIHKNFFYSCRRASELPLGSITQNLSIGDRAEQSGLLYGIEDKYFANRFLKILKNYEF